MINEKWRAKFIGRLFKRLAIGGRLGLPLWAKCLIAILFPLQTMYERNSNCYYDYPTKLYYVNGIKFSPRFFKYFNSVANQNKVFRFVRLRDGIITIEEMESEHLYNGENDAFI